MTRKYQFLKGVRRRGPVYVLFLWSFSFQMYETIFFLNPVGLALRGKTVLFRMERNLKGGSRLRDTQGTWQIMKIANLYSSLRTFKEIKVLHSVECCLFSPLCKGPCK